MSWQVLGPDFPGTRQLDRMAARCGYRVRQLSQELGRSESYIHRVFLRDIGLSPGMWLREQRLLEATRLLRSGKDVATVAAELGFADPGGLRREFLAFRGKAPGAWRQSRNARAGDDS